MRYSADPASRLRARTKTADLELALNVRRSRPSTTRPGRGPSRVRSTSCLLQCVVVCLLQLVGGRQAQTGGFPDHDESGPQAGILGSWAVSGSECERD